MLVSGAHWLNEKEGKPFKPLDPATLHPGFGLRSTHAKHAQSLLAPVPACGFAACPCSRN